MIVYLHIGTPKSGTSYVQDICTANRERLAADGILWPGREWGDQVLAVRDVLDLHPGGEETGEATGAWERFVAEVNAWTGRAVVLSMEWLVHATPAQVGRIVRSLLPHEVRVILTARDLARCVPAQWQEQMQNWATWTWEGYLAAVTADDPLAHEAGRQFWWDHDLDRILRTWAEGVPADRISLVTVPGRSAAPELLWERFAQIVAVDAAAYDTDLPLSNNSLGAASAELMRRVNVAGREQGLTWQVGDPILKWVLAKLVLTGRRGREARLVLPAAHHEWAVRESQRLIAAVEATGVPVVGSLTDLMPTLSSTGLEQEAATTEELLEAAVHGLAGLAVTLGKMSEISVAEAVRLHYEAVEEARQAAAALAQLPGPRRPVQDDLPARVGLRRAATRARTAAARLRPRDRAARPVPVGADS
jgi:hypothetical protein